MTPITPKNILSHELIGLDVIVNQTKKLNDITIQGKVVDESKNILTIEVDDKDKKLIKKNSVFQFNLPGDTTIKLSGSAIAVKPEERIKRKIKRGW